MSEDGLDAPKQVLDGEWLTCWDALNEADKRLRRSGVRAPLATGEILARMAAAGYLPTISDQLFHTARIVADDGSVIEDHHDHPKEWRLVRASLWGAMFGFCAFSDRHIAHQSMDWERGSFMAVFTKEKLESGHEGWELLNDPGFYILMARNVLVYRDGLYALERFIKHNCTDDDLYAYGDLDLSQVVIPDVLANAQVRDDSPELGEVGTSLDLPMKRSRGRSGGKNGEPIAALTIKLMAMDDLALAACTADSAGAELQGIYAALGDHNRNFDNCSRDAAGILRAVRGARGIN